MPPPHGPPPRTASSYRCAPTQRLLFSKLNNCTFVEITEDIVYGDRAKGYLRDKAREHNIKPDRSLYREIADSKTGYTPMQLNCIFDRWLSKVLKTKIYPQYAEDYAKQQLVIIGNTLKEMTDINKCTFA